MNLKYTPLLFGILLICLSSCSPEPVEFKRINNIRVISVDGNQARVKADAFFYNPNKTRGQVRTVDIIVLYKEEEVAHVSEQSFVRVKGKEDFIVPLDINLDVKKVQDNWLGNLISILQDKSVELHFTGSIKVKFSGISRRIPVDYTEKIKL